jgi:lipoate-protein ligase A
MNAQQMVSALNVPDSKLAKRDLDSAAQRVITLKELLGEELPDLDTIKTALVNGFTRELGISAEPGEITENEETLANRYFIEEIGTDEFVAEIDNPGEDNEVLAGSHTGPGGTIDAFVKLEGPTRRILQRALVTGDFFVTPPRIVFDLEAHLAGTRIDEIDDEIDRFFADNSIDMLSVAPDDFKTAIHNALR